MHRVGLSFSLVFSLVGAIVELVSFPPSCCLSASLAMADEADVILYVCGCSIVGVLHSDPRFVLLAILGWFGDNM